MADLAQDLLNLRFVPRPLQSLYLNNDRVAERFTSHLGAIIGWTREAKVGGGGGVDLKVVKGDIKGEKGNELSYDLSDITVRALLLRDALQAANVIRSPKKATVGQYVIASGRPCLRPPDPSSLPPQLIAHEGCLSETDPRFLALEEDRARQEAVLLALAGPDPSNHRMWLLTLKPGADVSVAAVLNSLWINDAVVSYMSINADWAMFGTLRERIGGVPTLAAIHVWVNMADDVMVPEGPG